MLRQQPLVLGLFIVSLWSFLCYGIDLYRADSRSPAAIESAGGFLPKGLSTVGAVSADISLWNHVHGAPSGASKDNDGYVSTTSDPGLAARWVTNFLRGNGYIYRIHAAPNMIDCEATLGRFNPYPDEKEFAAIGGIKNAQIIGWTPVKNGVKGKEQLNPFFSSHIYSQMGNAGAQYKLAAFPAGHQAWSEDPWKAYSSCNAHPKRSARDLGLKRAGCGPAKSNQAYAHDYLGFVKAVCSEC
ncbi:Cholera enterotoxin subunit A2 [Colletotrichum truncatum]|uniref:Cholera enterotoxin subunit A2 n=1 Tax=Colletotrichum truncatum TaxID=5467 RepID=A0ACC3Z1X2_COLTU|nr:Cholera enterotoxin subunit A2 [Colletotrichum truncatum]KAF6781381.1 Cholera enterotoxin subunit A2 [Colletotrichum truncatum]